MRVQLFQKLSLLVFFTFVLLTIFYAWQDNRRIKEFLQTHELPSIGMALSASLDLTAGEYYRISNEMQRDDFLKDWILSGEKDLEELRNFLKDISIRFHLADASIVSDRSDTYYSSDSRVLKLDPKNTKRDGWYYHYRDTLRATNIDTWYYAEKDELNIWVNTPLFDKKGDFLGLTGVGVNGEDFTNMLMTYGNLDGVNVYLARLDGQLVYANDKQLLVEQRNINKLWETDLSTVLKNINNSGLVHSDELSTGGAMLWIRYMEPWKTWLVVEKTAQNIQSRIYQSLKTSALLGSILGILLFLVIFIALTNIRRQIDEKTNKLEYQAGTDPLTGLNNRSSFSQFIENEIFKLREKEGLSAILLMDIDKFKRINDNYGHPTGDKVLQCVAKTIQDNIRQGDIASRFGGEEFMVLLSGASLENAKQRAEQIRIAVSELVFDFLPHGSNVTISIGISLLDLANENPIDKAYKNADEALYTAKSTGRNKVVSY